MRRRENVTLTVNGVAYACDYSADDEWLDIEVVHKEGQRINVDDNLYNALVEAAVVNERELEYLEFDRSIECVSDCGPF
jgi:hypothetical protein